MNEFEHRNASNVDRFVQVEFYQSPDGFTEKSNPAHHALEPEDRHMFMKF